MKTYKFTFSTVHIPSLWAKADTKGNLPDTPGKLVYDQLRILGSDLDYWEAVCRNYPDSYIYVSGEDLYMYLSDNCLVDDRLWEQVE